MSEYIRGHEHGIEYIEHRNGVADTVGCMRRTGEAIEHRDHAAKARGWALALAETGTSS